MKEGSPPPPDYRQVIMVVDDEDLVREVLTTVLTEAGYRVVHATNGQEALRKIYASPDWGRSGYPDLIIADIMMPVMNGFELCQRVKSNPALKPIPFLFLTVRKGTLDRAQGFLLGCQRYLVKPFARKDLIQAVNERLVDAEQTQTLLGEHEAVFAGEITQTSALSIVDLFLIGGWSGTAFFEAQHKKGRIEFASGEVLRAVWEQVEGEEALSTILAQVEGTFRVERAI